MIIIIIIINFLLLREKSKKKAQDKAKMFLPVKIVIIIAQNIYIIENP